MTAFGAIAAPANPSAPETVTAQPKAAHTPAKPAAKAQKAPAKKTPPAKSKSPAKATKKRVPTSKVDLSLPPEMVRQLRPLGAVPMPAHKPLLPNMFVEKQAEESPFN